MSRVALESVSFSALSLSRLLHIHQSGHCRFHVTTDLHSAFITASTHNLKKKKKKFLVFLYNVLMMCLVSGKIVDTGR